MYHVLFLEEILHAKPCAKSHLIVDILVEMHAGSHAPLDVRKKSLKVTGFANTLSKCPVQQHLRSVHIHARKC